MFIHYNNGESEKLIKDVLCVTIVDGEHPAIVALNERGDFAVECTNEREG